MKIEIDYFESVFDAPVIRNFIVSETCFFYSFSSVSDEIAFGLEYAVGKGHEQKRYVFHVRACYINRMLIDGKDVLRFLKTTFNQKKKKKGKNHGKNRGRTHS